MREVVLEANGLLRGSSGPALETFLRRHDGIHHAEASYMSDTMTVGYDEQTITQAEIERLIEQCSYHCRGEVVPHKLITPDAGHAAEPRPPVMDEVHADHADHAGNAMQASCTLVLCERFSF